MSKALWNRLLTSTSRMTGHVIFFSSRLKASGFIPRVTALAIGATTQTLRSNRNQSFVTTAVNLATSLPTARRIPSKEKSSRESLTRLTSAETKESIALVAAERATMHRCVHLRRSRPISLMSSTSSSYRITKSSIRTSIMSLRMIWNRLLRPRKLLKILGTWLFNLTISSSNNPLAYLSPNLMD